MQGYKTLRLTGFLARAVIISNLIFLLKPAAFSETLKQDKNPGHLKVALVAMKSLYSDSQDIEINIKNIKINLERHLYFIDKAVEQGAEFIGFPELSINGYRFSKNMMWLKLNGPEISAIQRKAIEKGVYIGVGIAEED